MQRIRTEGDDLVKVEFPLDAFLVGYQLCPMAILETGGIAGRSQSTIAPAESTLRFLAPRTEDCLNVERTTSQIPLVVWNDLHLAGRQIMIEFWNGGPKGILRLFDGQWIGRDPDARFVGGESFLEVGDKDFQQIVLRFIELAEMRSPRNTIWDNESGLVQPLHRLVL